MPRGLYSRAALILLLPVIGVQFVVSVVFLQRHFEDVTEQMSRSVALELTYLTQSVDDADDPVTVAQNVGGPLALSVDFEAPLPQGITRAFYDLSGAVVARTLEQDVMGLTGVDLCGDEPVCRQRIVRIGVDGAHGPMTVTFDRRRVSASNPHQLLVIMVVLGAIMTMIAYLFLRNQLRPVARMARAAEEFGRGNVVPYRIGGATEVRAAGRAFLEMRDRVERQAQARRLMLSGISHDLRTPLTRMRLELSMMEEDAAAPLLRDVADMQKLVDAFLDYARGDAADAVEECDPVELLEVVVSDAQRGGGDVTMDASVGARGKVRLRPMAMRRALDNLIGNALRHGTQVSARFERNTRYMRYVVEDNGPGIPEEKREEAMRPFTRLDLSRNQDKGSGVGLGLAIVADIARTHGGRLELGESDMGGLKAVLVLPG